MSSSEESAKRWAKAWKKAAKFNHSGWAAYCSAGANQQKALKERAEEWEARHAHVYDELCEAVSRAEAAERRADAALNAVGGLAVRERAESAEALRIRCEAAEARVAELEGALQKIADATVMGHEYSVSACVHIIASAALATKPGGGR